MRALIVLALFLAACPSKQEKEAFEARMAEADKAEAERKAKDAATVVALEKLAATMSSTCAAEFERLAKEGLVPGAEQPCELGTEPQLFYYDPGSRSTLPELAVSMKKTCEDVQKELDLVVKRNGPGNPSRSAVDAELALKKWGNTWVVGVRYDKSVRPEVLKDSLGNPKSFKPGLVKGDAYLYRLSSGKIECAAKVEATNSEKVGYFKSDKLGDEGTSGLDVIDDLEAQLTKALVTAPKLALVAAPPAAAPAKGAKAAKKKGKGKR